MSGYAEDGPDGVAAFDADFGNQRLDEGLALGRVGLGHGVADVACKGAEIGVGGLVPGAVLHLSFELGRPRKQLGALGLEAVGAGGAHGRRERALLEGGEVSLKRLSILRSSVCTRQQRLGQSGYGWQQASRHTVNDPPPNHDDRYDLDQRTESHD